MFSSIRAKFLAILLPLFLVSFIVLSGISYYVSNGALVYDADVIARRTGGMAGEYLDKVMTEKSIRLDKINKKDLLQNRAGLLVCKKTAAGFFPPPFL